MHALGHYGVALCLYAPVGFLLLAAGLTDLALAGGAVAVGATTIPDVDLRIPLVPHRGPTHTVWFAIGVAGVCGVAGAAVGAGTGPRAAIGVGALGAFAGLIAIGAHLLADVITPMGIRPFAPLRDDHYTLDLVRAANPLANVALLALGILVMGAAAAAGTAVADMVAA